jgi:hypothetical protein
MPDDPQLIFEHRRGGRNMPSRPLRQLTEAEADQWIEEVGGIDKRSFNALPRFAPQKALREAATASVEELNDLILSPDLEIQRVAISEAVLRREPGVAAALDRSSNPSAIRAMWSLRRFRSAQKILTSWKDSPSKTRCQTAVLYLGTAADVGVRSALAKMADEEMRNVIPRSGKGADRRPDPSVGQWPASARHILAEQYLFHDAKALAIYRLEPKFLLYLGTPEAFKAAHGEFQSDDFYLRKALMMALGDAKAHEAQVPTLVKGLSDEEAQVRIEAAKALAKVGDKSTIPALQKAYKSPPPSKPGTGLHITALTEIATAITALGGTIPD